MRAIAQFAVLLATTIAAAQPPRTSESIEVSIVNIDVVVTDRRGNRVTGLTANDFEIREAGKLQSITHFAEYRSGAESATAAASPVPAAEPRPPHTVVLFIEPMRLPRAEAKAIFDAMRALLRDTIGPNDRAMIVSWDRNRSRSVVRQPFTSDLTALEIALAGVELEHTRGRSDLTDDFARERREALVDAERLEGDEAGWIEEAATFDSFSTALEELHGIRRKAGALQALMSGISPFDGRKIVVMSMRRFGAQAGAGAFPGAKVVDGHAAELDTTRIHEALIRTANANDVVLYPVHPARLFSSSGISARTGGSIEGGASAVASPRDAHVVQNELVALQNLAVKTGGIATSGAERIAALLPQVAEDLKSYYSLGYRAPGQRKDMARRIAVRTKDPQYTVRTRTQFVEKSDVTLMKERLIANLHEHLEASSIPVSVQFGAVAAKGKRRWQVPLEISFPMRTLTFLPEGRNVSAAFSVYVMVDTMSDSSEAHHQTQSFRVPDTELESAKASPVVYDFVLEVDDKAKLVSVGVVDETAKTFGLQRVALPPRGR